jgi:aldehyde:ferredoxin oxidoreductase
LILCRFFRDLILWDELIGIIKATTGIEFTKEQLEIFANNITQKTRQYNNREGIGPETDTLPKRFLQEATKEGAAITAEEIGTLVGDYNRIRSSRK